MKSSLLEIGVNLMDSGYITLEELKQFAKNLKLTLLNYVRIAIKRKKLLLYCMILSQIE